MLLLYYDGLLCPLVYRVRIVSLYHTTTHVRATIAVKSAVGL
jgi:hypothetical protein